MILFLRAIEPANIPFTQPSPIDRTWQPSQVPAGPLAKYTRLVIGFRERLDQFYFTIAGSGSQSSGWTPLRLKLLINPGNEEHVPQTSLNRARARKEFVGQEVTDNPNAQLIPCVTLAKQRQNAIHSV